MQIFTKVSDIQNHLASLKKQGLSIGFVPTMGALHQGHLALTNHSAEDNDITVVSIFVNPTQFNNPTDLEKYPRNTEADITMLETTGCDVVFLPSVKEVYPEKTESIQIDLKGLDKGMEGTHRPGHFDGVATVINRFFEILNPTRAYFGQKDYQQLLVVEQLTKTMNLPVEIVGHQIERSDKGLALSSRNQRLTKEEKEKSLIIYDCLNWMKENAKDLSPEQLTTEIVSRFENSELELEYVQIVDQSTLNEIDGWENIEHARAFIAAFISGVRLIDNMQLF